MAGRPMARRTAATTAKVTKLRLASIAAKKNTITARGWFICTDPFQGAERDRSARCDRLSDLTLLPEFELPEELVLLLLGHRLPAGGLLTLVDKPREDRLEILEIGRGGYLYITLQPLLGGRKSAPSGKLCRDIDLAPFWMVARFEQRLEPSKKRLDNVHKFAVAV